MQSEMFLPPPFTWFNTVDITQRAFRVPSSIIVCEIRCTTSGTIKVDSVSQRGRILQGDDYDIWRLRITRVHRYGTDVALRDNQITLFGYLKSELVNH